LVHKKKTMDRSYYFGLAFVFHFSYFFQSIKSVASLVYFFTKLSDTYYKPEGVINSLLLFNSFKVEFFFLGSSLRSGN
jgi:hypothetical protein